MKAIYGIFLGLIFASTAFAQDLEGATISSTRPVDVDVDFQESYFQTKSWINEFRYVAVVNKATKGKEAQTVKLYEYGSLITQEKVSTGRDKFEKKGTNGSKADAWTVTPTGYYTPTWITKLHKSSQYSGKFSWLTGGARMPYAVFFNGGIAFHEVAPKAASGLGKPGSGGCIRLPESMAADLFYRVQESSGVKNPRFTVTGQPILDKDGKQLYATKSGYSMLVIVINKVIE